MDDVLAREADHASRGAPAAVLTVGHSNRTLEAFLELLREAGVAWIADVRAMPRSRRNPHFAGDALAAALAAAGIGYEHFAELGGLRAPAPDSPDVALAEPAFRAYAGHMRTPEFGAALERLIRRARTTATAAMCAEADPGDCHRSLLADALVVRGVRVEHLLAPGERRAHALDPRARLERGVLVYAGAQATLPGL